MKQNLATEERKYTLGLNTSYEVLQAEESYDEARSGEIGALIEYTKTVGRMERARQGYLGAGRASLASIPISLTSGMSLSGGSLPSGVDASMLQQYSSMIPAGIDINQIMSMMP